MNYQRIVQWFAGPVSIVGGWLSTQLAQHVNLGDFGTSKAGISAAVVKVGTFAVGAGVTYAAHHKWLDNAAKWWALIERNPNDTPSSTAKAPSAAPATSEAILRKQLQDAGLTPGA